MSASPSFTDAFNAVMRPAAAPAAPPDGPPIAATEPVEDFIADVCDVLALALDEPAAAAVMPGVDVDRPVAMLKAYLLFLACEGGDHDDPERVTAWYDRVTPSVWTLLGFDRSPSRLSVQLAFALACAREHQAPELRGLILTVNFFAASGRFKELAR